MTREERDNRVYVAGLLGGDGHVALYTYRYPPHYSFAVTSISNCDLEELKKIQGRYGGHIKKKYREDPRHTPCYELEWRGSRSVKKFLLLVRPFMRIRRKQVEALLTALDDPAFRPYRHGPGRFLPEEIWLRRKNLANSVNSLNAPWKRRPIPSEAPEGSGEPHDGERVTAMGEARKG